jgi:hypothetical protein
MNPMLTRTVVLRHDLPDGQWHYDWLLQRATDPAGPLTTFRIGELPTFPGVECLPAQRLPDHRHAYLDYEGPVSGDRGTVARVLSGTCSWHADTPGFVEFTADFGSGPKRWRARPIGESAWRIDALDESLPPCTG